MTCTVTRETGEPSDMRGTLAGTRHAYIVLVRNPDGNIQLCRDG
jgi:hypothetical protein